MTPYYDHAGITLYHGDCREILPTLGQFDLLLTDPPYGISLENHDTSGKYRAEREWTIANDESTELAEHAISWARGKMTIVVFASPDRPYEGKWRNRLVWHKHGLGMGGDASTCWKRDWELILVDGNGALRGSRESAVLTGFDIRPAEFALHPCAKPVRLLSYLIYKCNAQTILDPFAGSGTTLVAAKLEGRRAVGIEINERYCEIAAKRLAQGVLF